jgi:hypothetical protein
MEVFMFVLGRHYKLTWQSSDGGRTETSSPSECIDISLPMVRFRTVASAGPESRETVVNVTSAAFLRADLVPIPPQGPPEKPPYIVSKL